MGSNLKGQITNHYLIISLHVVSVLIFENVVIKKGPRQVGKLKYSVQL